MKNWIKNFLQITTKDVLTHDPYNDSIIGCGTQFQRNSYDNESFAELHKRINLLARSLNMEYQEESCENKKIDAKFIKVKNRS